MTMPNNTGPMTKDNMVERVARAANELISCLDRLEQRTGALNAATGGSDERGLTDPIWRRPCEQLRAAIATMHGSDSGVTEALAAYAREASIELMIHAGGGSEMFKRIGDEWYADPALCRERIIDRMETARKIASRLSSASAPDSGALREAFVEALAEMLAQKDSPND